MHYYHAFGLRIASVIELPELHAGQGPADVEIERMAASHASPTDPEDWFDVRDDVAWLKLGGIQFAVDRGTRIRFDAPVDKSLADIRIWLLGTVTAALLHQRGYLPVHANVIALGGTRAAAFAGDSGAGKSTLAAWFEARGHRVLADDLCAIAPGPGGVPQLFEGIPRAKLWSDALVALGRTTDGLERVASDRDKYHVPMRRPGDEGSLVPFELKRFYVLDCAEASERMTIQRLSGAEATQAILDNAFRWAIGQQIQGPRPQFDQCVALARHAAVFRVRRRWGMEWFAREAEAIERHMVTPLAGHATAPY